MRFHSVITVLAAGLSCLAIQLPAQSNWPGTFSLFSDSGVGGSRLGVGLRDIDPDRANIIKLGDPRGVEVIGVEEKSPAEQAGIKIGDVLLSYNGESIVGAQQLGRLVSETPRGRKVKIEYWREGKVSTITATTAAPSQRVMAIPGLPDVDLIKMQRLVIPDSIPTPRLIWRTPLIGIEGEFLDPQLAEFFGVKHGVLVRSVVKDSPGGKAGLRAGDVVTQIGDRTVSDPKDIASYVRNERRSYSPLSMEIVREHKPITIKVILTPDTQE